MIASPKRRWLRFSIRELMLLIAIAAAAIVIWTTRPTPFSKSRLYSSFNLRSLIDSCRRNTGLHRTPVSAPPTTRPIMRGSATSASWSPATFRWTNTCANSTMRLCRSLEEGDASQFQSTTICEEQVSSSKTTLITFATGTMATFNFSDWKHVMESINSSF
jgi:hypothetical protein